MTEAVRPLGSVMPRGVEWIRDGATDIDPAGSTVSLASGGQLGFGQLVVCPGLQLDWDKIPGMAEAMRAAGRASTPFADLSRGVVGVIGRTLVVNLPGSPRGAIESLTAIEAVLDHALETLAGPFDHDHAHDDGEAAEGAGEARGTGA